MAITAGSYKLGPETGKLLVRTKKGGAASKAGHNLLIEVGDWSATLDVGADGKPSAIALNADSSSMTVLEGTGGAFALGEDDKDSIAKTIDEEVLKGTPIEFHSTTVQGVGAADRFSVNGVLELAGERAPAAFELGAGPDGKLTGTATVKQTQWGIKPYSALFGTLKVLDEVTVEVDAQLPVTEQREG
jgi:hypothetical protein